MTTGRTQNMLEWFRSWCAAKLGSIGRPVGTSEMSFPLDSDARVVQAINYLSARKAVLEATFSRNEAVMEPFWQIASDECESEYNAAMPNNIANLWTDVSNDTDPNARRCVKLMLEVTKREVQEVRCIAAGHVLQ
jgi:hypothetical protein